MWKIHAEKEIAIAHELEKHEGKCKFLHGHNLLVEVDVTAHQLIPQGSSEGMVVDFSVIKTEIDSLDHQKLNDFFFLLDADLSKQPTAERLAKYLAVRIYNLADNPFIDNVTVKVHEAKGQWAEYSLDYYTAKK